MAKYIPVTLLGNNLGERHRYLNSLVNKAFESFVPFETVRDLAEASPVDRLFKIDLASKHKDVNYVIKNLKDKDMLYVTRALKCTWLLEEEYKDVVNVDYLEDVLFPEMTTKAINKMQHWLQHHLRDPKRCLEFYEKYKERKFNLAVKFLWHCSSEYILEEFTKIITKIEPQDLKVLSEKCPQVTKTFYEHLKHDSDVINHYLIKEKSFYANLKLILKSDPDTFFYVTEKYFNASQFKRLSVDITKYIMTNHKLRFTEKPELYTTQLLNIETLANYLSAEEIKELVIKLAKTEYLANWFTYQAVEPLIKRLDSKQRVELKKLVFVDRVFGDKAKQWPYKPPNSPIPKKTHRYGLFLDTEQKFKEIYYVDSNCTLRCMGKTCKKFTKLLIKCKKSNFSQGRSLLDTLFDNYRFATFETTFFELRKRLRTESSLQNREFMMLVLVSKTGGNEDKLNKLFELLVQYKNEPVHWRAAIVRSLVKRAFAWRLPKDLWVTLLEWAHGLGLDGSPSEAACDEGLHAVVLRNILDDEVPHKDVLKTFFDHFTHFNSYALNATEKNLVRSRLPNLLLNASETEEDSGKLQRLDQLIDTLLAYRIKFDDFPEVVSAIISAVHEIPKGSEFLLHRLYKIRVCRRQLFKENFFLLQNNTSYSNALRHDTSIFDMEKFKELIEKEASLSLDQFLNKLAIYFNEKGGLAEQFYATFKLQAETKPHKYLARPLTYLAGNDFTSLLEKYQIGRWRSPITKQQRLAAELRANAHNCRPQLDLNAYGWQAAGPKAIANFVLASARNKQEDFINDLVASRRTLRLALAVTQNDDTRLFVYETFVASRPGAALKYFLRDLKKEQYHEPFIAIWENIKPLITRLDYKKRRRLFDNLIRAETIPVNIIAEYCVLTYQTYLINDSKKAPLLLVNVENMFYDMEEEFLKEIISNYFDTEFVDEKIMRDDDFDCESQYYFVLSLIYPRIIAKVLLACSSVEMQREKLEKIGDRFFRRLEDFWKDPLKREHLITILNNFLIALKCNKVFFEVRYVSCFPVFERVVSWMHKMLPIEEWFHMYENIHLIMLYYKTAGHCVLEKPEYFTSTDNLENIDKGIDMFADIFGKLIANECKILEVNYFSSIWEIYGDGLVHFIYNFFDFHWNHDQSKEKFFVALVKSILEESEESEAHFIANILFRKRKRFCALDNNLNKINNLLKDTKNDKLRLFLDLPII